MEVDREAHPGAYDRTDSRLGRNLWLDARSLAFTVEGDPDLMALHLRDRMWDRVMPVLDQGGLGACTGFAGTGALGTAPYWGQVGATPLARLQREIKPQRRSFC